jgi:hypothetical protein
MYNTQENPFAKKKKKENFGEVVAVVKLTPEQQEEQLRPLGLANEAKLFQITKSVSLFYLMYFLLCVCKTNKSVRKNRNEEKW